jgi:membrane-bound lytic murein transglycosylase MltF
MSAPRIVMCLLIAAGLVLLPACTDQAESSDAYTQVAIADQDSPTDPKHTTATGQDQSGAGPGKLLLSPSELGLPPELDPRHHRWTGDYDKMVERRLVRVLTVYQAGGYYLDGPQEKGVIFELVKIFEKFLNERIGTGNIKLHVVIIPVEFDQLIPALVNGHGDIAVAGLTITPEREEIVDFSRPFYENVSEVVITGPAAPAISGIGDLAGQQVYVKPGSSYRKSLEALNEKFLSEGKAAIEIIDAPPLMQDLDLLEMVSAGLLPMVVMDDFKARFWVNIMEGLTLRDDLVIRSDQSLAWAMRKNSPLLQGEIREFARTHGKGTLLGNVLIKRYLKNTGWIQNALDPSDWGRFNDTVSLFKQYAARYNFNYLMVAALGYQESGLDQEVRSHAGAIGIMQMLKSTATDPNVGIPDIEVAEHNIHAGVKYLDFLRNRYFSDPDIDVFNRTLFSFAAYNAGPARVRGLMRKAEDAGLDPNQWFNNVELIAAREIGRETVDYVSNIYKYYFAYSTILEKERRRAAEKP